MKEMTWEALHRYFVNYDNITDVYFRPEMEQDIHMDSLKGILYINRVKVKGMFNFGSGLFGDKALDTADLRGIDISGVQYLSGFNGSDPGPEILDISNWDFSHIQEANYIFGFSNLKEIHFPETIDLSSIESYDGACGFFARIPADFSIPKIILGDTITDLHLFFNECTGITSIDNLDINTSKVTNMRSMFAAMINCEKLNLSTLDTSNVEDMTQMFADTYSSEIDLSSFDTRKVTSCTNMFKNVSATVYINPDTWTLTPEQTSGQNCTFTEKKPVPPHPAEDLQTKIKQDIKSATQALAGITKLKLNEKKRILLDYDNSQEMDFVEIYSGPYSYIYKGKSQIMPEDGILFFPACSITECKSLPSKDGVYVCQNETKLHYTGTNYMGASINTLALFKNDNQITHPMDDIYRVSPSASGSGYLSFSVSTDQILFVEKGDVIYSVHGDTAFSGVGFFNGVYAIFVPFK